ncbi:MAG: ABC transporter substrate-binding protein [Dehalococcoidales bacterium]
MGEKVGKWWDKLGKPQYGGEMVIRASRNIVNFDPYFGVGPVHIVTAWMERLVADDWTLDPAIFDYKPLWHPSEYLKGQLAENWEFSDARTYVAHLRKGIHWQNIPPANGREFVADDVVFHFNRLFWLGGGFTKPSPFHAAVNAFQDLISVTAIDKYTVVFKFKISNPEIIMETLHSVDLAMCIENPDAVRKWGDLRDWHHAIGTGSFMFHDFDPENSATLVKNPDYWGYDERYPQNRLPYLDTVKYLYIPDDVAALAAMREGKIDVIDCVSPVQAQSIRETNPEILQILTPLPPTISLDPRIDVAPFNDIRVRQAMQMAIDLPAIAKSYYHGLVEPYPDTLTSRYMKGWGFPYQDWPRDLKDEYAYNPVKAKQLLADAGYPDGFKTNLVADIAGDLNLLKIVKSYFAEIGIDMEIRPMETNVWNNFVADRKHDQLVHHPAGHLGHTSSPLRDLYRFQSGSPDNYGMVKDPVFDALYDKARAATTLDTVLRIFRDANEYVARQHIAISVLQPMAYSLCQPWLKGFNAQFGSTWGAAAGPGMLSFYLGRFWIDQKIKKLMIH